MLFFGAYSLYLSIQKMQTVDRNFIGFVHFKESLKIRRRFKTALAPFHLFGQPEISEEVLRVIMLPEMVG